MNAQIAAIEMFVYLLAVHWLADFVFQNDQMAQNKSTSNKWLSIHVGMYTAVALLFSVPVFALGGRALVIGVVALWLLNAPLHWLTDYVTSRWSAKLYKAERRHDFFVVIGLDQLIHHITIAALFCFMFLAGA